MKNISKKIKFKKFPKTSFISHDVDTLQKYYTYKSKLNRLRKNFLSVFNKTKNIVKTVRKFFDYRRDPYWMFDEFYEIEKKYNIISSYYILLDDKEKIMKYNYKLLLKLLKKLNVRNNEIGFHAGIETCNSSTKFENELKNYKKLINREKDNIGCRQHYLKFDVKKTWDIQNEVGINYDTSLAFPERVGFRAGTSKPFKVFSLVKNKEINLWEIPLIVMDVSLLSSKYMNLTVDEALNKVKKIIDIVDKYNGVFSLLIHNSVFFDYSEDWIFYYEKILKILERNNFNNKSGLQIVDMYNTHI